MDAHSTPEPTAKPAIHFVEVFPPETLTRRDAREILAFCQGEILDVHVDRLAKEPRQRDSFLVLAFLDQAWGEKAIAGYLKLQHGRGDELWIRQLLYGPPWMGRELVEFMRAKIGWRQQLVAEVGEDDQASQERLSAYGLEAQPPALRTKRQVERRVYEFRTWQPPKFARLFAGEPRFTWPAPPEGASG